MTAKRYLSVPIAALALAVAAPAAGAQDAPAASGSSSPAFVVKWKKLKKPNRAIGEKLRRSGAVEQVADAVNDLLVIPRTVRIIFNDQADIGPAYIPDQKGQKFNFILFPGWFLRLEHDALRRELRGVDGLGTNRAVQYANQFIIAHEIGHALVSELKLPITGKEEDAVDGFAAYLLTADDRFGPLAPVSAAALFDAIKTDDGKLGESDFADEHSLPQQRVYQFLCWVYGSDTKRYRGIVGPDMLPKQRAVRCAGEYRQLRSSWDQLLAPHLREAAPSER